MQTTNKDLEDQEDDVVTEDDMIEKKILLILEIYPVISSTMLQSGLGPQLAPAKWRPVLEKLLEEGTVIRNSVTRQGVSGRHISVTRIGLARNMVENPQ